MMFSANGKPMTMLGTYVGTSSASLRAGHEYKFDMQVQPSTGYWEVVFSDLGVKGLFSCIDALYKSFIHLKMIMPDGHVVAF